jgi:DNA-binding CsgD family transcriptional regulator
MTRISAKEQLADPQIRWVAMWRDAVRACSSALGLIELETTRFIELSPAAAELLGTTPAEGTALTYMSIVERPWEVALKVRLGRDRAIDGARSRFRIRRPDGSTEEVVSFGWAIRCPTGPDLGLWTVCAVHSETEPAPLVDDLFLSSPRNSRPEVDGTWVILDQHWRMAQISSTSPTLLGRCRTELLGRSIIECIHPDDLITVLFAFARATSETGVRVRLRLLHSDGSWRPSVAAPMMLEEEGASHFALALAVDDAALNASPADEPVGSNGPMWATPYELGPDWIARILPTGTLSPRQWEILALLVEGERVRDIAAALYLSPSTIRNHLTAIFQKVGVHSQTELLAMLLRPREAHNPTE